MRIAFLADVHSNLEALTACLADAESRRAGKLVFLGDLVGYGGDPAAVVRRVMKLVERGAVAVLGNHEEAVTGELRPSMHVDAQAAIAWTRERLDREELDFLKSLPVKVHDEGRLYVHANAWAPEDWEYVRGEFQAERSMRATPCRITVCGHVHEPALYHMSGEGRASAFRPVPGVSIPLGSLRRWLLIPGSAGQPRDGNPAACYAVYDDEATAVTYFRVPYDHETAARKILEAGLPEALSVRLALGR